MSWLDRNLPEKQDKAGDDVLAKADALDPADQSEHAEYLREVAEDVRDHRSNRG